MIRTHDAGSLRAEHAGHRVTLAGWVARRRDHGGVTFIDLRDGSGVVQVVFRADGEDSPAHALRTEYCVKVTGEVRRRPDGNENPELPTGDVEVAATDLEVLSEAAPLPFPVDDSAARTTTSGCATATWICAGPNRHRARPHRGHTRSPTCCTGTASTRSKRPT